MISNGATTASGCQWLSALFSPHVPGTKQHPRTDVASVRGCFPDCQAATSSLAASTSWTKSLRQEPFRMVSTATRTPVT